MFVDQNNIQKEVDDWVNRKIYTKAQGEVIVAAVKNGFYINVGPKTIPERPNEKIVMKTILTLEID